MAKFCSKIGFAKSVEKTPGVWDDEIIERKYYGDFVRKSFRWENTQDVNDNLTINHSLSIIADSFALENAYAMKYVIWRGVCWEISNCEEQHPRLILYLGGVYNGPTPKDGSSQDPM